MKRIILLLLIVLFIQLPVLSEYIPPNGCGYTLTKETNPIYFGYMEDYSQKLKEALDKSRMFRLRDMGAAYEFYITRNGEIKDMKLDISQGKYFDRKIKEIIESVEPLPFRDGMNVDEMFFHVYLGYEHYDEFRQQIGGSFKTDEKVFGLMVITKK